MPKLYVVATPIGNLSDLSPGMARALTEADLIAAEDTRVTMKLLSALSIKKPMISCHRHNERERAGELIARMIADDLTVCLTSDAGTPGISDPGQALVDAAWEAGIPVSPVAGPSAVAAALSVSGFDAREFAFYGFLPRENKPLIEKLDEIAARGVRVNVFYESPHRVVALIRAIAGAWPESRLCVACDLTKKFERVDRGSARDVLRALEANLSAEKGEYCVVADISDLPAKQAPRAEMCSELTILDGMLKGLTLDEACARAMDEGAKRNDIYRAKLAVKRLTGGDFE